MGPYPGKARGRISKLNFGISPIFFSRDLGVCVRRCGVVRCCVVRCGVFGWVVLCSVPVPWRGVVLCGAVPCGGLGCVVVRRGVL